MLLTHIQDINNNEYQENQPWPRVKHVSSRMSQQVSSSRMSHKSNQSVVKKQNFPRKNGGGVKSSISGSTRVQHFRRSSQNNNSRTSRSYIAATTTTTCTKTLVSLKSCRSISEIETLPPTGYFASTVVQSTYVNDDFVSDNEEDSPKIDRNSCCKER